MICYQKNTYHLRNVQVLDSSLKRIATFGTKTFSYRWPIYGTCHGKLKNIPSNKGNLKKKQTKELWCLPMCKTCKTYNDRLPLLTKNCNLILTWAAISEAACFGF